MISLVGEYAAAEISTTSVGPVGWALTIFGALYLALAVAAIASISNSTHDGPAGKFLWFLAVVAVPVVGALVWFAAGKRKLPDRRG